MTWNVQKPQVLDLLPVNLEYNYNGDRRFWPQVSCYKHAFFGFDERTDHNKIIPSLSFAKKHVLKSNQCRDLHRSLESLHVLLIQRHHREISNIHREISNIHELESVALDIGVELNITVSTKETHSVLGLDVPVLLLNKCYGRCSRSWNGLEIFYAREEKEGLVEVAWKKWECYVKTETIQKVITEFHSNF